MLDDASAEATRLIGADTQCRNTIVVLVVGGAEGNSAAGSPNPATAATSFLNVSSRRVPIYVVAIAPPAADVAQLQSIAANSGGQYFEITKADDRCGDHERGGAGRHPRGERGRPACLCRGGGLQYRALRRRAVRAAQRVPGDEPHRRHGQPRERQRTSPARRCPPTWSTTRPGTKIPQRSNVMVTSAFSLPGFDARLRAFRVYKPVADGTAVSGYKFTSDGTRLWVAAAPAAASRNIYTVLPDRDDDGVHGRQCGGACAVHEHDGGGCRPAHRLRAQPSPRGDRRIDAGDDGRAVGRSAAGP